MKRILAAFAKDNSANIPQSILSVPEKFVRGMHRREITLTLVVVVSNDPQDVWIGSHFWPLRCLLPLILIPLILFLVEVEWFFWVDLARQKGVNDGGQEKKRGR
jgi:hypothetical protein